MTEPDIETIVLDLTGAWHDEPRDWIGDVTLNEFLGLRPEEGTPFARDGINPPRLARYWRWLHAALGVDAAESSECGGCKDLDAEADRYRSDLTVAESDLADALVLVAKLGERGVDYGPGCGREGCPCRFPGMPCAEWAGDSDSGTWCPRCGWARHHHPSEPR